jgi:hypothetical protein
MAEPILLDKNVITSIARGEPGGSRSLKPLPGV